MSKKFFIRITIAQAIVGPEKRLCDQILTELCCVPEEAIPDDPTEMWHINTEPGM